MSKTNSKRETFLRLHAYRSCHGIGAFARIAEASGGTLTIDMVMDMYNAFSRPPVLWARLRLALDLLEQEEHG